MAEINGTGENDTLTGTGQRDIIRGFAGDDTLLGGGGFDAFYDGPGSDTVYLGDGGGVVLADTSDSQGADVYVGNIGDETTVNYLGSSDRVFVNLRQEFVFGAATGRDEVVDINTFLLTANNDVFHGNDIDNRVFSGGGDDVIYTYGGNDEIEVNAGSNTINSGDGNDHVKIQGSNFSNRVDTGNGDDGVNIYAKSAYVQLGSGNDVATFEDGQYVKMFGGDGNDQLFTYHDGYLSGGTGDDLLYMVADGRMAGGAGADRFFAFPDDGRVVILDFEEGVDKLSDGDFTFQDIVDFGRDTVNGLLVEFESGAELFVRGMTLAQIDASDFI